MRRSIRWSMSFLLTLHFSLRASGGFFPDPSMDSLLSKYMSLKPKRSEDDLGTSRELPRTVTIYAPKMAVEVKGTVMKTINGSDISAFQGIRYAEQPTRFQPPTMLDSDYYLNENPLYIATHLPKKCSQSGMLDGGLAVGTEDCLFLNVYTPQSANAEGTYDTLLPVMLYVHGGSFTSGDTFNVLPTRLLDKEVMLVTIQYRLGLFGFFSTGTSEAKGNAGLYDQQMAMQWVRDYIEDFGGDPDKVTIFGESAGAHSVTYHLLSQFSKDLFRGVIAESGSALNYRALDPDPVASAIATAEALKCDGDLTDMSNVLNCAESASESDLVAALGILLGTQGFLGAAPIVQDFLAPEEDPIVPMPPEDAFSNGGLLEDVSLMIGANRDEGSLDFGTIYWDLLDKYELLDDKLFLQEELITLFLKENGVDDKTHAISESLAAEYLGDVDRTDFEAITPGMIDLCGMFSYKAGPYEYAKLHSLYKGGSNTFFYTFDYQSDDSMFYWFWGGNTPPFYHGVTHTDEMMYIFSLPADLDSEELQVKDRMVELWTNFAIDLHPTPDTSTNWKAINVEKWEQFDVMEQKFMVMEDTFHLEQYYTKRWTINTQGAPTNSVSHMSARGKEAEEDPAGVCQDFLADLRTLQEDYNDLDHETNIYMGLMIGFIVMFTLTFCEVLFLAYKVYS